MKDLTLPTPALPPLLNTANPKLGTRRFSSAMRKINQALRCCPFCEDGNISVELSGEVIGGDSIRYHAWVECPECETAGPDICLEDAYLAAVEAADQWNGYDKARGVAAPVEARMLTRAEWHEAAFKTWTQRAEAIQRKFCEVNGISLAISSGDGGRNG